MRDIILNKMIEWVKSQDSIRLAVLEGSLASETYVDELSDIDINLFCNSYDEYLLDDTWISSINDIIVYIPEKFQFADKTVFTRLVIFANGVKADFSFWRMDILDMIISNVEPYYQDGHKVLVDKDNISNLLPKRPDKIQSKIPTEKEFESRVMAFWFNIHYVAKYLKRDEIWFVKYVDSLIKDEKLLPIIEWYAAAKSNWETNTHFKGRHIKDWLPIEDYQNVCKVFSDANLNNNWEALFNTLELFRNMAIYVANKLNFQYPLDVDEKMTRLLQKIRDN